MTKSETMVERVARAICALTIDPDGEMGDGTPYWTLYVPEARAAIEAMRCPSPEMQADMRDALDPYVGALKRRVDDQWHLGRLAWFAGIHAALSEEGE